MVDLLAPVRETVDSVAALVDVPWTPRAMRHAATRRQ
jgi:hypothetical protein